MNGKSITMKIIYTSLIVLSSVFVLSACNSDNAEIKKTATEFITDINHKDFKGATEYATASSKDLLGMLAEFSKEQDSTQQTKISNEKITVSDIKITGNEATANISSESEKKPVQIVLKKENKKWKVAFDKDAISKMTQNAMQTNPTDVPADQTQDPQTQQVPNAADTTVLQLPK